jgi:hypothetical protein
VTGLTGPIWNTGAGSITSDNEYDWTESGAAAIFIETALAEPSDLLVKNVAGNTSISLSAYECASQHLNFERLRGDRLRVSAPEADASAD